MRTLHDFNALNPNLQTAVIALLAREFYGEMRLHAGIAAFQAALSAGKEHILALIEVDDSGETLLGVGSYKRYAFSALADQCYYQTRGIGADLQAIRLRSFNRLLEDNAFPTPYEAVYELAYAVIPPEHRGHGLYRELFRARLDALARIAPAHYLVFTVARSQFAP